MYKEKKMEIQINTKNYVLKSYLKEEIEKSLSKLDRFFNQDTPVYVSITGSKNGNLKMDITVNVRNNVLRSETTGKEIRTMSNEAVDKIVSQLKKYKEKLRKRDNSSIRFENIEDTSASVPTFNIVRNKSFTLTPMTPDEACFQLELLNHMFYVFKNKDDETISVVYKINDGDYGLIEVK